MSYFRSHVHPAPNPDDEDYWRAISQKALRFQRCNACMHVVHPPIGVCPKCQSVDRGWVDAPGTGKVYSFTWVHTLAHADLECTLPYNVAVVEFPELGVRMISNVIDVEHGQLRIGQDVRLTWDDVSPSRFLPRFSLC